eukprot:15445624-Alexandrium_andersonii.AAC.1
MSDQATSWNLLQEDIKLLVAATLRAVVSMFATLPYRFAAEGSNYDIDATGWALAAPFFRCASQLCGSDALRAACKAQAQIGKMDTETWEGA